MRKKAEHKIPKSSHLDYLGKRNFSSVTQRDFILKFFVNSSEYKKGIQNWLKDLETKSLGNIILE